MITPEEFQQQVNQLSAALTIALPSINEAMALDAAAMVKDRVINTGVNSKGASLGKYSENELPSFFFKDKSLNASGEKFYLDAKKKGKGISYKEWREANNRPADHVTLSFTGQTMKDIGVVKQLIEGGKIITAVGSKNTKVRDKGVTTDQVVNEFLGPRYGNFMEPNKQEIDIIASNLQKQVNNIISNVFKS